MEVVIDINEHLYKIIKTLGLVVEDEDAVAVSEAIRIGKVLPKGHGGLVDIDEIKKRMIPLDFSVQKWISEVDLDLFTRIIIEADREIEDE